MVRLMILQASVIYKGSDKVISPSKGARLFDLTKADTESASTWALRLGASFMAQLYSSPFAAISLPDAMCGRSLVREISTGERSHR